jgi:hypothetical protein
MTALDAAIAERSVLIVVGQFVAQQSLRRSRSWNPACRGLLSQMAEVIFRGFALFRNVGESPAPDRNA